MRASPILSQRLWLPKTANAALVHINSLTLVLNVMKAAWHAREVAIVAESQRKFKCNPHILSSGRALSGQYRDVVMLWSDEEVRPPSQMSDTA